MAASNLRSLRAALPADKSYVQRAFPLRYWSFVLYAVGVPVFIRFDNSGLTHANGLFNPWAVATMALTSGCALLFLLLAMLGGTGILTRRVYFSAWVWSALLVLFSIATVFEPSFITKPKPPTDLYLSFYRLGEWVLGFLLFLSLYSREPRERAADLAAHLIGRICWAWLAIVWCVLPFAPSFALSSSSDEPSSGTSHARLGGYLIPPGTFAVLAGIACFYSILRMKGLKRIIAVCFAALSVAMTYVRGEAVAMLLCVMLYVLLFARGVARWIGAMGCLVGVLVAAAYSNSLVSYMERGNGASNIFTLSERTAVWEAAFKAFWKRPWIGYGFVAGVKGALRDEWKFVHWVPPHAHNDWIQALLTGGVVAAILLVFLYLRGFWSAVKMAGTGPAYLLFLFTLLQLAINSFLGPLLTTQFGTTSAIFLIAFVAVVDNHRIRGSRGRKPKKFAQSRPVPANHPIFAQPLPDRAHLEAAGSIGGR